MSLKFRIMESNLKRVTTLGLLVTIGIVFGDIGTSPLYVMKAITGTGAHITPDYIIGAVSCVIWTLTLLTTVKYVLIALKADNKGEGGILALFALLRRLPRKWLYLVAGIGASALIADGVITPAITVTSAIEGLHGFSPDIPVIPIVIVIICSIFLMQKAGTGKIGKLFGPIMLLWFLFLGVTGSLVIGEYPAILKAFNPWYAVKLLISFPEWWLILGAVFLCTTGAEALYSDMGHCGRLNISFSWIFVKLMLILNYLGQGAWILANPTHLGKGVNPFFAIMPGGWLMPAIILSTCAAIIASQALLSGSFTIFSEAMSLDFWPRLKVKYPSLEKGQLYIPVVNWALFFGCLVTVCLFRDSSSMEAAYGLAITVTMLMTTLLLTFYLRMRGVSRWICTLFLLSFSIIEGGFFVANCFKFLHGGWFTILIAGLVAFVMINWRNAVQMRDSFLEYKKIGDYTGIISDIRQDTDIPRTAANVVYLSSCEDPGLVESKLIYSIINKKPKRADHYFIIRVVDTEHPDTLEYEVRTLIPGVMFDITMRLGFRVDPKVTVYLRQVVEDLVSEGALSLRSPYGSLGKRGIAGDFRFILIHRVFSSSSFCSAKARRLMSRYAWLRHIGITDENYFGLDTSNLTVETVPLVINTSDNNRIQGVIHE